MNAISGSTFDDVYARGLIPHGVIISTVHKAKGKSFDTVIVPSVVEGNYPYTTSTRKNAILDDARSFYVAISRARSRLILTFFDKGRISYRTLEPLKKTSCKHKRAKVSVREHLESQIVDTKPSRFIVRPRGIRYIEHS